MSGDFIIENDSETFLDTQCVFPVIINFRVIN